MFDQEIMPWFSPAVSPEISRVMHNLGYRTELWPGDQIGRGLFRRVVFVERGFVANAVLEPGSHTPFQMIVSGPGSFAVTGSALCSDDNQPRSYWALTPCTTLSVSPEILLRLSEVESSWNQELSSYYRRRCVSEKFGQMVCHVAKPERRFGVFLASSLYATTPLRSNKLNASPWVKLPALPSRKLIASVISCSSTTLDQVVREWVNKNALTHENGALWMKRTELQAHWQWLKPFFQMQKDIENAVMQRSTVHFSE